MIQKQMLLLVGIILIIAGIVLISIFLASSGGKGKVAVVGFIGPFPFGAGNDAGLVKLAMILTGIAILAFVVVGYLLPRLLK